MRTMYFLDYLKIKLLWYVRKIEENPCIKIDFKEYLSF